MDRNDFVGTWTLVGLSLTDREGVVSDRHRDGSMGRIIYAADGNMGMMTRHRDGTTLVYFGRYEIADDYVVHHIEMSPKSDIVGTAQRRQVTFRDGRLVLTASPSIAGGPGSSAELTWQRA